MTLMLLCHQILRAKNTILAFGFSQILSFIMDSSLGEGTMQRKGSQTESEKIAVTTKCMYEPASELDLIPNHLVH